MNIKDFRIGDKIESNRGGETIIGKVKDLRDGNYPVLEVADETGYCYFVYVEEVTKKL